MKGTTIPVEITIYNDRSFEFITKSPPAAVLLKQAAGIASGSAEPQQDQGRHSHRGAGPQDRRDQVRRPERPRPRPRLPDHRRHGPEHGRRSQGLIAIEPDAGRPSRPIRAGQNPNGATARATARRRHYRGQAAALPKGERGERLANAFEALSRVDFQGEVRGSGPAGRTPCKILKGFGTTKFNQTVEVSTNLGIDPRQSDQNVRGSVALPHGIGKSVRVAVFAQGENAEKARERRRRHRRRRTTWRSRSRAA